MGDRSEFLIRGFPHESPAQPQTPSSGGTPQSSPSTLPLVSMDFILCERSEEPLASEGVLFAALPIHMPPLTPRGAGELTKPAHLLEGEDRGKTNSN